MEPTEYRSVDPASGELQARFAIATDTDLEQAIIRSAKAFDDWRRQPLASRIGLIARAAELLESKAAELAQTMATEMGKPVAEGRAEAEKCAWVCRYYAENAEQFLSDSPRESDGSAAWVRYDPLGPIVAVMPWNFPFWQFFRFAAPALIAGNAILLKHSPNTPRCALAIEALMKEAGTPEALVQNLFLSNSQVANAIADRRVRAVTLTGSTRAGRAVAATAGAHLKPIVLELGGSDACIVLDDADLEQAVATGVLSRCINTGQSCIAAKRFIVQAPVFDRFSEMFVDAMAAKRLGDPTDAETQLGPLAREDLRDQLADQVEAAMQAGGRRLLGGTRLDRPGFYYPATVIADAPIEEEWFGPAAALLSVADEDEAIALANSSIYGLGSSVWSENPERAQRVVERLETGAVFVNGLVKSDPRLPFGGVKDSGYGRELGREGMFEFTNPKTVWVR